MYIIIFRLWFLRPLKDISVLRQRLDAIEFLSSVKHNNIVSSLTDCLKNIKNIPVSEPLNMKSIGIILSLLISYY